MKYLLKHKDRVRKSKADNLNTPENTQRCLAQYNNLSTAGVCNYQSLSASDPQLLAVSLVKPNQITWLNYLLHMQSYWWFDYLMQMCWSRQTSTSCRISPIKEWSCRPLAFGLTVLREQASVAVKMQTLDLNCHNALWYLVQQWR